MLLLSTRLSTAALSKLVKNTGAGAIITSQSLMRNAKDVLNLPKGEESHLGLYLQVNTEEWFVSSKDEIIDLNQIIYSIYHLGESGGNNEVFILHSSGTTGTTGLPKAIPHTYEFLLLFVHCHDLHYPEAEGLNVSSLPLFHVFSILN
jgi:acyl-coenzyme A synthetase/AMP-(fatty) acid ligase